MNIFEHIGKMILEPADIPKFIPKNERIIEYNQDLIITNHNKDLYRYMELINGNLTKIIIIHLRI